MYTIKASPTSGIPLSTCSICEGKTLMPRITIISSTRPVILSICAPRPQGHSSSRIMVISPVRYLKRGIASLTRGVMTSSPDSPGPRRSSVSGSMISTKNMSCQMCRPERSSHSKAAPGPYISLIPYESKERTPSISSMRLRVFSDHGSAPNTQVFSVGRVRPISAAVSARCMP